MIDDKLATGMVKRYLRELERDADLLINAFERMVPLGRISLESRMRKFDNVLENVFGQYLLAKLLVLDKKRSQLEALMILPANSQRHDTVGAFVTALIKVTCTGHLTVIPMRVRSSFHWTMRVFKRRGAYDPRFVRQELRGAIVGLNAFDGRGNDYEEIPSFEGVSVVTRKNDRVEAVTYMTDAQASGQQEARWSQARQHIASELGLTSWLEVLELIRRVSWVGVRKGRRIEVRPKKIWRRESGEEVVALDYDFADCFIGLGGPAAVPFMVDARSSDSSGGSSSPAPDNAW